MLWNSLRIGKRIVERQLPGLGLPEQLDHDRHLHRAGGVELLVGIEQQLVAAVERAERDRDFGAAVGDDRHDALTKRARQRRRGARQSQREKRNL